MSLTPRPRIGRTTGRTPPTTASLMTTTTTPSATAARRAMRATATEVKRPFLGYKKTPPGPKRTCPGASRTSPSAAASSATPKNRIVHLKVDKSPPGPSTPPAGTGDNEHRLDHRRRLRRATSGPPRMLGRPPTKRQRQRQRRSSLRGLLRGGLPCLPSLTQKPCREGRPLSPSPPVGFPVAAALTTATISTTTCGRPITSPAVSPSSRCRWRCCSLLPSTVAHRHRPPPQLLHPWCDRPRHPSRPSQRRQRNQPALDSRRRRATRRRSTRTSPRRSLVAPAPEEGRKRIDRCPAPTPRGGRLSTTATATTAAATIPKRAVREVLSKDSPFCEVPKEII